MRRPQFTLRALLVLLLAVACFFGGIRFERERQRRQDASDESGSAEPWVLKLKGPFTRVYPIVGPDGENTWVTEPPT